MLKVWGVIIDAWGGVKVGEERIVATVAETLTRE